MKTFRFNQADPIFTAGRSEYAYAFEGQFDGYNNTNYQHCANACLPAWPRELQDVFSNFQDPFKVNPQDATFFGNNTPAMTAYFSGKLGLTKVPFKSCPTFQFYKK